MLGPVGIWSIELRTAPDGAIREAAHELDQLGFGALWIPGMGGGTVFDDVDRLLQSTDTAAVVLGVLGMWGQEPEAVAIESGSLNAENGNRFLTGLGVSSPDSARHAGSDFRSPLGSMEAYLDRLDHAPAPLTSDRRILGALGPKMVELAGRRAAGIHPFLVTPESSVINRDLLGSSPLIAPHLATVLETDPTTARAIARAGIGAYIGFPSYQSNLRRLGFDEKDLVPGGSDRLIDALVAWGDVDAIQRRVDEHLQAGADHVALHVLTATNLLPLDTWRQLAQLTTTHRTDTT